jgi:hypothetical protein
MSINRLSPTVFSYPLVVFLLIFGCGTPKDEEVATDVIDSVATDPTGDTADVESTHEVGEVNDVTVNVLWGGLRDVEAVGTVWIAVYASVPDGPPEAIREEPFMVTSLDIDEEGAAADAVLASYTFEDLPVTTDLYYLNTFLDVNGNADLPVPLADSGDVWARGGVSGYPAVSAAAKNAEANIALTFVLP